MIKTCLESKWTLSAPMPLVEMQAPWIGNRVWVDPTNMVFIGIAPTGASVSFPPEMPMPVQQQLLAALAKAFAWDRDVPHWEWENATLKLSQAAADLLPEISAAAGDVRTWVLRDPAAVLKN